MTEGFTEQWLEARQKGRKPPSLPRQATIGTSAKASKHRNRKTLYKGVWFDSAKEAARYQELDLLAAVGAIRDLERQIDFDLWGINGERIAKYRADFVYWSVELGRRVIEDAKSPHSRTLRDYRIKFKLMRAQSTPITET